MKNNPVYESRPNVLAEFGLSCMGYPSCVYQDAEHERMGIVSPALLQKLRMGAFGHAPLIQYEMVEKERIRKKVNERTCTRDEWKALKTLEKKDMIALENALPYVVKMASVAAKAISEVSNALDVMRQPLPKCRVCGCDTLHACPGGCWWVEDDLCSRCAEKQLPWHARLHKSFRRFVDWLLTGVSGPIGL